MAPAHWSPWMAEYAPKAQTTGSSMGPGTREKMVRRMERAII